jgi:hypothetical protein
MNYDCFLIEQKKKGEMFLGIDVVGYFFSFLAVSMLLLLISVRSVFLPLVSS